MDPLYGTSQSRGNYSTVSGALLVAGASQWFHAWTGMIKRSKMRFGNRGYVGELTKLE